MTIGLGVAAAAYAAYARLVLGHSGPLFAFGSKAAAVGAGEAALTAGGVLEAWDLAASPQAHERESWQINYRELRFGKRVGVGNVGEVYAGLYRGRAVAIKKLLGTWCRDDDMVERFREEILLMSSMNHANVLHFIGAVMDRDAGNICLVTELCSRGTLHDVLHSDDPLPWRTRVRMAWEIARGMGYLHTQARVIQRDLKSQNLLVTEHLEVKVADFGLARTLAPGRMETYCGTPATMAPEIVKQQVYDEKADVFSFAIIMWELLTREEPYPGMTGLGLAMAVANEGLRPPVPAYCPAEWARLMVTCWDADARVRPSFDHIQRELHSMLTSISDGTTTDKRGSMAGGTKSAAAERGMRRKFLTRFQDVVMLERGGDATASGLGGDAAVAGGTVLPTMAGDGDAGMATTGYRSGAPSLASSPMHADGGARGEGAEGGDAEVGLGAIVHGRSRASSAVGGGWDGIGGGGRGHERRFGSAWAIDMSSVAASAKEGLRWILPVGKASAAPSSAMRSSSNFPSNAGASSTHAHHTPGTGGAPTVDMGSIIVAPT